MVVFADRTSKVVHFAPCTQVVTAGLNASSGTSDRCRHRQRVSGAGDVVHPHHVGAVRDAQRRCRGRRHIPLRLATPCARGPQFFW